MLVSTPTLREVQPGDPITADRFNAVVRAVQSLVRAVEKIPAPGQVQDQIVEYVVVARYPAGSPPLAANTVTYDLDPVRLGASAQLRNVKPDWGRPVEHGTTAKIIPAEPGDRAFLMRFPGPDGTIVTRLFIDEKIRFRVC